LVPKGPPIGIVGFPNHPNVGDAAIWAGETTWLRRHGHTVSYACDLHGYAKTSLASAIGSDGTILFHGGGNFGDVWPDHQLLRERVVGDFPTHRIVSLPQTMQFSTDAALERARTRFNGHPNINFLLRDRRSLERAQEAFTGPSQLCPDLAFALGPFNRIQTPDVPRLWLSRTDTERTASRLTPPPAGNDLLADWLSDDHVTDRPRAKALKRRAEAKGRQLIRGPAPVFPGLQARVCDALAHGRVHYGRRLLSRGEVVITDRLHAHILCVLSDIPHVIVETGYGKIRDFHATWTSELTFVRVADDSASAIDSAEQLI
jgi:exopolysaccharide biosynthesis predicted pyruvyltransferase EpsI